MKDQKLLHLVPLLAVAVAAALYATRIAGGSSRINPWVNLIRLWNPKIGGPYPNVNENALFLLRHPSVPGHKIRLTCSAGNLEVHWFIDVFNETDAVTLEPSRDEHPQCKIKMVNGYGMSPPGFFASRSPSGYQFLTCQEEFKECAFPEGVKFGNWLWIWSGKNFSASSLQRLPDLAAYSSNASETIREMTVTRI